MIRKYFGQTVMAHEVYRDLYPLDRGHHVMKSTCWETLGVFIAQLRKEGRVEAHKGVKGWQIRISDDTVLGQKSDNEDVNDDHGKQNESKQQNVKRKIDEAVVPVELHSASSKRLGDSKLVFSFGNKSVAGNKPSLTAPPSAFDVDDS
jgi:hypothetical protein